MSLRIATFNVENLMNRFDFSGFRNQLNQDRTLALYQIKDEAEYRLLEQARAVAHTDDTRQLTALAIAETHADIICLQEVDNIEALKAFEYGYLFKMIGEGYRQKFTTAGNDSRGIDVAVMMRDETRHGQKIEFVRMTSHASVTFEEFGLHTPELEALGIQPYERIFRRDCLEIDVTVGGMPLTIYAIHFKSMGAPRDGVPGRDATMPVRIAEAKAVRRIIEDRFGKDFAADKRWMICGDFNDYRQRIVIGGDALAGFTFAPADEPVSCLDVLLADGFAVNIVERRPSSTAGRSITRAVRRSGISASSTTSCCRRRSPARTRRRCPTSSGAGSRGARSSRRARRSSAIRVPAGIARRRPTIARSPSRSTSSE